MIKFMILLVCICIVSVFAEFQSLIHSLGMSFVGGIICLQASQTCCDIKYGLLASTHEMAFGCTLALRDYKNVPTFCVFSKKK